MEEELDKLSEEVEKLSSEIENLKNEIDTSGKAVQDKVEGANPTVDGQTKEDKEDRENNGSSGDKVDKDSEGDRDEEEDELDEEIKEFREGIDKAHQMILKDQIKEAQDIYRDLSADFRRLKSEGKAGEEEYRKLEELHEKVEREK